jgi:hypothetical protein
MDWQLGSLVIRSKVEDFCNQWKGADFATLPTDFIPKSSFRPELHFVGRIAWTR